MTTTTSTPTTRESKPLASLRFGAVSTAVFERDVQVENRTVPVRSISLRRAYRDANGVVHFTSSLRPQDLLPAAFALLKAFDLVEGKRFASTQAE